MQKVQSQISGLQVSEQERLNVPTHSQLKEVLGEDWGPSVEASMIFALIMLGQYHRNELNKFSPQALVVAYHRENATRGLRRDIAKTLRAKQASIEAWFAALGSKDHRALNPICIAKIRQLLPKTRKFSYHWANFLYHGPKSWKLKKEVLDHVFQWASYKELIGLTYNSRNAQIHRLLERQAFVQAASIAQRLEFAWFKTSDKRLKLAIYRGIYQQKPQLTPQQSVLLEQFYKGSKKTKLYWWMFELAVKAICKKQVLDWRGAGSVLESLRSFREQTIENKRYGYKNRPKYRRMVEIAALNVMASNSIGYDNVINDSIYTDHPWDLRGWYPRKSPEAKKLALSLVKKALRRKPDYPHKPCSWTLAADVVNSDLAPWPELQKATAKELTRVAKPEQLWHYLSSYRGSRDGVVLNCVWQAFLQKAPVSLLCEAWLSFDQKEEKIKPRLEQLVATDPEARDGKVWASIMDAADTDVIGPVYLYALKQFSATIKN